jgi:hypothetical protein
MDRWGALGRLGVALTVSAAVALAVSEAHGGQIGISAEDGVSEAEKAEVQRGVEAALGFFDEVYGTRLKNDVRIILVPNRDRYLKRQMTLTRGDAAEAERRSQATLGWNSGDSILQNTGDLLDAQRRIYNISHELAHSLQHQACAGTCSGIAWLDEGNASAVGWHVIERCRLDSLDESRRWALGELKGNSNIVYLRMLRSAIDWESALAIFDEQVYHTAALAVCDLIRTKGHQAVFAYFRNRRNMDAETAFEKAFGVSLPAFEEQFDRSLRNELEAMR